MTKKIFQSIMIVAILILISSFMLIMGVMFGYFGSLQENQLKTELKLTTHSVERDGIRYLKRIKSSNERFTYIRADGKVLYDSIAKPSNMENHKDREEFRQAIENGNGKSVRYSSTLTEKTIYHASKLSNGDVLRVSISRVTAIPLILGMMQPILIVLFIALLLSYFIAKRMAGKIIKPLNKIDLDRPLENDVYDELTPLLLHIENQKIKLKQQKKLLLEQKEEFNQVIKNMNEGLVLLDKQNDVISLNRAAKIFFDIEDDYKGKNFIYLDRDWELNNLIENAKKIGKSEVQIDKCDMKYQLNASRISDSKGEYGVVILILDITEKYFLERNRREFTSNVSHELKTPVHSIMGSAELIERGLVRNEDLSKFIKTISEDASRLNSIIEDIMKLSKLEEDEPFGKVDIDLKKMIKEEIDALKVIAKMKNIDINVFGEDLHYFGSEKLLHQCLYNLIENGIKYNCNSGELNINLSKHNDKIYIEIEDTGIGIASGELDRIFERFYRVDKSRSKESGGTGLGLSIVKHSVEKLKGKIFVESKVDIGTKFTLVL